MRAERVPSRFLLFWRENVEKDERPRLPVASLAGGGFNIR